MNGTITILFWKLCRFSKVEETVFQAEKSVSDDDAIMVAYV
jgi:hypothetical protein